MPDERCTGVLLETTDREQARRVVEEYNAGALAGRRAEVHEEADDRAVLVLVYEEVAK